MPSETNHRPSASATRENPAAGAPPLRKIVTPLTIYDQVKADRTLGAIVVVHANTGDVGDQLYKLGFRKLRVSGRRDGGGPGHRVGGFWFLPKKRYTEGIKAQLMRINAIGTARNSAELMRAMEVGV